MAVMISYVIVSSGAELQRRQTNLSFLIDELPPEGVIVKTSFAGVCHTDLHIWLDNGYKISDTQTYSFKDRPGYEYPTVPGHEISGTVFKLGKKINEDNCPLHIGDSVCVYPFIGCMYCYHCVNECDDYCIGGTANEIGFVLDGGFAEYVGVPHYRYVLPIPPGISLELASIIPCSCLTAFHATKTCLSALPPLDASESNQPSIGVLGLGGLGLWTLELLPLLNSSVSMKLTGIDVNEEKLCDALKLGLIHEKLQLLSDSPTKIAENWKQSKSCFNAIIDFVNNPLTHEFSMAVLGNGGVLIAVGLFGGTASINLPLLTLGRKKIYGIQTGSLKMLKELLKFIGSVADSIKGPKLTIYKLSDCMKAVTDLKSNKVAGRAILSM
jgi:propanol-preferring alcohol dehydrogenase